MAIFTIEASEKEDFERWKKEHDKQIRAEVIDEVLKEVEFEEKWLFDCYIEDGCKYSSKDINIAFGGIKNHLKKLKEQKNDK